METTSIKKILKEYSNDIAFVIGNGVNRYSGNSNISWRRLLLELWERHSDKEFKDIPEGISFTEFYDALEIQNASDKKFSHTLQKEVKNKMVDWVPSESNDSLLSTIKQMEAPILTTNFDDLIVKSLDLNFYKMIDKPFTDYYPWSCYYSDKKLDSPLSGFGVWYPNGMIKYQRSIKLGLSQYMGNVERARELIKKHPERIGCKDKCWSGHTTWLHIFFNKSLFIFGLGLDETEVFIRWLLIERAKYYKKFDIKEYKGWYLATDGSVSEGKRFFLESVGFEVIEVENYDVIYRDIWK